MSADPSARGPAPAWTVLLVDDEPGVHEASRLILSGLKFDGCTVRLLSAGSAAQAREILADEPDVALVLLDVVMETDHAGMALVHHIRERMHDKDMQIVLRTGQPGMAPEREVVQQYEINGYILKTEVTAQRLHSIVISALRSYRNIRSLRGGPTDTRLEPATETRAQRQAFAAELVRLARDELVLLQAQPVVELSSNLVVGIELVPLWPSSRGLLPATRVSETVGEGPERVALQEWMVVQACRWARTWRAGTDRPLRVSVPLLGERIDEEALIETMVGAARSASLPAGAVDLLVSEATLSVRGAAAHAAAARLRAAGYTLTLVDFGAETISLQRLNRLVPDRLKVHRLFVRGVADDAERMAVARSLIALAQTLQIAAIADGVASDADAQFFKWEGCDLGQGDVLAPSCAPVDVLDRLRDRLYKAH